MAQNPFDNISKKVFDACDRTFGYDASWTPSNGDPTVTGRVLFGEPSKDDKLGEFADSFNLQTFFVEWWEDDFTGLQLASQTGKLEDLIITFDSGDRRFMVRHAYRKYDGKNYRAQVEEMPL